MLFSCRLIENISKKEIKKDFKINKYIQPLIKVHIVIYEKSEKKNMTTHNLTNG